VTGVPLQIDHVSWMLAGGGDLEENGKALD
jgi:hypothetical protein